MLEIVALLLTALMLITLDIFWFKFSFSRIYEPAFEAIQKEPLKFRVAGGIVAWLLIAAGIRFLVVDSTSPKSTMFLKGALLGFVVYGVYNGTNYATLNDYTLNTALVDTLWGTLAVGTISVLSSYL